MISKDYRERARISLKNRWMNSTIAVFIYNLIIGLVASIAMFAAWLMVFGMICETFESLIQEAVKEYPYMKKDFDTIMKDDASKQVIKFLDHIVASLSDMLPVLVGIVIIAFVLYLIVNSMLSSGLFRIYLDASRMKEIKAGNLFSNIVLWKKMLGVIVCKSIIIGLGYLLIIPGIIFTFKYMLAPFVLIDNPDMGVRDCLHKSGELVQGRKWNLFCLCCSYIGWAIIASWLGSLINNIIMFAGTAVLSVYWVYLYVGIAHFYLNISGQDNTINREELYNNEN